MVETCPIRFLRETVGTEGCVKNRVTVNREASQLRAEI